MLSAGCHAVSVRSWGTKQPEFTVYVCMCVCMSMSYSRVLISASPNLAWRVTGVMSTFYFVGKKYVCGQRVGKSVKIANAKPRGVIVKLITD